MPSTYTPIATLRGTSSTTLATSITFSSIPATYTDLILLASSQIGALGNVSHTYRFNGDTASNYSTTILRGNGTTATSERASSSTYCFFNYGACQTAIYSPEYYSPISLQVFNYANTNVFKTSLSTLNSIQALPNPGAVDYMVGLWRNTSAITSITILTDGTSYFPKDAIFTLYGIKAA